MSKVGGPTLNFVENNVSASSAAVGHYKGVMLCNRPFGGTMVTQKSSVSEAKQVFATGVTPSPIGSNVPIAQREKQIKRPNKDSVLVKHKKWLSDLQKTKERVQEQYLDDMRKKEEEKAKFQDTEKKMREVSRTMLRGSSEPLMIADSKSAPETEETRSVQAKESKADAKAAPKGVTKALPAWAVSEEKAAELRDMKQQQEEDDLLDFAQSLDYEKFIEDMEVRVIVEKLRERIGKLEQDVQAENDREADAETRAARREMIAMMNDAELAIINAEREKEFNKVKKDNAALHAARALLGEEEDIQAVHSTKSVVQLLKNAKEKIQSVQFASRQPTTASEPRVQNEPKIVLHEANEGARLEEKKNVNKLPYMHRNPAI